MFVRITVVEPLLHGRFSGQNTSCTSEESWFDSQQGKDFSHHRILETVHWVHPACL